MKYLIVGLGSFGASLAEKLTAEGNEVIGVDSSMNKVEALKEKITHTICLDATDEFTFRGLPLGDTDVAIVAIGENQSANIMVTALLKNLNVKRLISRSINPLHENVIRAIGVDEIVHPEEETAERLAKKLCLEGVVDSFELTDIDSVVEVNVPSRYVGKMLGQINIQDKYNLLVITILRPSQVKSIFGKEQIIKKAQGICGPDLMLEKGDLLVMYGTNKKITQFISEK
jgi:trk system potassium uptake protein TrkA